MRSGVWLRWIGLVGLLAACSAPGSPLQPTEAPRTEAPGATETPKAIETRVPTAMAPTLADTMTPTPDNDSEVTPTPNPDEPVSGLPGQGSTPGTPAWSPQPGDQALVRGNVFIDAVDVLVLESFPPQIQLHLTGNRPTPCHELRVAAAAPDAQNRIEVEVYTVVDPNAICVQVLAEFDERIPLGTYPSGTYTVWVNGQLSGEFTV